jgi:copper(I)-binding protein
MNPRFLAALVVLAAAPVLAHDFKLGDIAIGHPYARPSAPSQRTGAGYLTLANKGADDRLISASTPFATSVEMHTMKVEGNMMRMREVGTIELPAGKSVEMKPGGLHLMLVGLKEPLVDGRSFPMKLTFQKAGEVQVDVKIEAPSMKDFAEHKH